MQIGEVERVSEMSWGKQKALGKDEEGVGDQASLEGENEDLEKEEEMTEE